MNDKTKTSDLEASVEAGRVDLPGGWYLVRDDEKGSLHYRDWFLSSPDPSGIWVAKFWDGPTAGKSDVRNFALSVITGQMHRAGI